MRDRPRTLRSSTTAGAMALMALLLTTTALSACSSSKAPAASVATSGSQTMNSVVDKAKAFIQPYLAAPSKIPNTTPLRAAPASGKTIVYLQCDVAQCKVVGDSVKEAASVVGWDFKAIPYQSTNPATLSAAFDQALQYKPVAVAVASPPFALWSQQVPRFRAAGIALIPSFTGAVPIDSTVIANPASPEFSELNGDILANWFIADSAASGNVLSVNVPDFPYLGNISQRFDSTVASSCPNCKDTKLNIGIPDVVSGAMTGKIVSALRKDPAIKYVVASDAAFVEALPSALKAAGLAGKVKLAGCCGVAAVEAGLKTGDFSAVTGVNGRYAGYATIDAALRFLEKSPVPANEGMLPVGLLTKDSLDQPSDSYDQPADFVNQYKTLWKLN